MVRARLSDVRGLPVGAPVTLAGLQVGTVVARRVGSGYAEIDIRFGKRIDLRKDAVLYKRRTSLLSGPSLEIDPGRSEEPLPGKYIERVVETRLTVENPIAIARESVPCAGPPQSRRPYTSM